MREAQRGGDQRGFLENPRLRLLFLAWLRGYIKADYQHGVRSRIREELAMRAVSRELEADHLAEMVSLRQATLPLVNPMARQNSYTSTGRMLERLQAMRKMMPINRVKDIGSVEESMREIRQMGAALKVLQASDLSAKLEQIAEAGLEQDL